MRIIQSEQITQHEETKEEEEEKKTLTGKPFTRPFPEAIDKIILSYLDITDLDIFLESGTKILQLQFFVKKPSKDIKKQNETALKVNLKECFDKLLKQKIITVLPDKNEESQVEELWRDGSYLDLYKALTAMIQKAIETLCSYDEDKVIPIEKVAGDLVFHFCHNNPKTAGECLNNTLYQTKPLMVSYLIKYGANLCEGGVELSKYSSSKLNPQINFPSDGHDYRKTYYCSSLFLALRSNYPPECIQNLIDHGAPFTVLYRREDRNKNVAAIEQELDKNILLFIAALNCSEETVQIIMRYVDKNIVFYVHEFLNEKIHSKSDWGSYSRYRLDIYLNDLTPDDFLKAKLKLMDAKESLAKIKYTFYVSDVEAFLHVTNTSCYLNNINSIDDCLNAYDIFHNPTNSVLRPVIWALICGSTKYADPTKAKEFKESINAPYTGFRITVIQRLQQAMEKLIIAEPINTIDGFLKTYDKVMAHPLYTIDHEKHGVQNIRIKAVERCQEETLKHLMSLPESDEIKDLEQYKEICLKVLNHDLFSKNQDGVNDKFRKQLEARIEETNSLLPEVETKLSCG